MRVVRILEYFAEIGEDATGAVEAKPIVEGDIRSGEFVELDADAGAPAGVDGFEAVGYRLGKALGIDKDDAAEGAIGGEAETVFGFQVEHVLAPEPTLDVTTA